MSDAQQASVTPSVARRNPPTLLDPANLGLSQISVIEPGRLAFVSGQTATPRDRDDIPSELAEQARVVAGNLRSVLDELAASPRDVVLLRMYVVDATTERFEQGWAPIREMLDGVLPSMTGIGVQALWTPRLQLEVEMVVRLPD